MWNTRSISCWWIWNSTKLAVKLTPQRKQAINSYWMTLVTLVKKLQKRQEAGFGNLQCANVWGGGSQTSATRLANAQIFNSWEEIFSREESGGCLEWKKTLNFYYLFIQHKKTHSKVVLDGIVYRYSRTSCFNCSEWRYERVILYFFFTVGSVNRLQLYFWHFVGKEFKAFEFGRGYYEKHFENHLSECKSPTTLHRNSSQIRTTSTRQNCLINIIVFQEYND